MKASLTHLRDSPIHAPKNALLDYIGSNSGLCLFIGRSDLLDS